MVGLVKVPSSHIRAVPCISGIRHKPLPKAALQLDGKSLVQVLLGPLPHEAIVKRNGGANSFSDSPLVGGQAGGVLSHVMRKDYEGLNFGSGQSGRLDRQVPVTEKCASWIVQAQLLQRPFYVVGRRCCLSSVRTLRRARALFAIRPALAVRRPWDPGSPEEVILDVCAGVPLIVAWRRSRLVFLGPCFSFSFPTVTGTEIDASQRQADGRKMPPRPLEKQIRLVECGTGLDPSCTKHGGGGEGEGRKRFRNQDLSDLSHGGESGCRAWGSQVLRMSPFKVRGGGVARIKDGRHSTGGGGKMLHRISTVEGMQMGMKKYEEVLHDTRPSPDPRSEDEDRSAAAPHFGAADLPFPRMRRGSTLKHPRQVVADHFSHPLAVGYYLHAARCESVRNSSRLYTALTGWETPTACKNRDVYRTASPHTHQPQARRQRLKEHFRSLSSVPGTWDYVRNVGGYGLMHAPSLIHPSQSRAMALPRAATCYTTHRALPDPVRLEGKCATLGPLSCTVGIVVP
ncbi:hypothetical protein ASPNIDRAFT_45301 [Aspergillus niger ATCC 1015]|uniref:Uncharacterized protein n=3 Tax=Aspergillus niger TaxID=5061 RepID=G3Y9N5_ASPNA|nr:hypothetical protein ASPNIDRAFT_45301 [Aspergillus niger ATCC 1015]RDH15464.1 hypothetical protein M747DRAFT_247115 [Aspergillus niger ATCC 13496]